MNDVVIRQRILDYLEDYPDRKIAVEHIIQMIKGLLKTKLANDTP